MCAWNECRVSNYTVLLCIGIQGNAECVRLMVAEGALMEAHDCHFGTPLHVACARQHLDCVKVLLNAGRFLT